MNPFASPYLALYLALNGLAHRWVLILLVVVFSRRMFAITLGLSREAKGLERICSLNTNRKVCLYEHIRGLKLI